MNSKLKFAPFTNNIVEGFETITPSPNSVGKRHCPPSWNQSGPYNESYICTYNCNGVFSYIKADSNNYSTTDTKDYCKDAKAYNPLDKENFLDTTKISQNNIDLTNGLPSKVREYLLTHSSLASDK